MVAADPYISSNFPNEGGGGGGGGVNSSDLDLNLCQFPYYPAFQEKRGPDYTLDEPRTQKRLKQQADDGGSPTETNSGGFYEANSSSNSNSSFNSLPKLQFRDYVWAYAERFLAIEAMEEADAVTLAVEEEERVEVKEETGVDGMKLVQQLIACAEAVACRDKAHASALLSELRANALVFGTSFQRVASCFVQGLSDRLTLVQPLGTHGVLSSAPARDFSSSFSAEKDEALTLAYELCPQIQFGHFVANASILEALEGESSIHVVDLGMTLGLPCGQQWQNLMHSIAGRIRKSSAAPRLRITGVGPESDRLQAIGLELSCYAANLGLNFEFMYIRSSLESLKPEDFDVQEGEAVVINSVLQMHCVVKESRGALNSVLQVLNELSPKAFILVEQDSNHNGPFFLGRFMESLHYYSAIFDSLDSMLPKYDTRRAKIEQFYFADEIKNIVSCEGPARVERHERSDQWRRRMSRAGFQASPLKMLAQAKHWLGKAKFCDGYTATEEKGCLVLGWQSRPIIAASCWRCSKI